MGYSHHEPCPRCYSRDNLARYTDGSAYCFGCSYNEPPTRYTPRTYHKARRGVLPEQIGKGSQDPWLLRYGLLEQEIEDNNIYRGVEGLIFPIRDRVHDRWVGYIIRNNSKSPKYTTCGDRIDMIQYSITNNYFKNDSVLWLVEDMVSAIKLGRFVNTGCLFGSTIPFKRIMETLERYKTVRIWLDSDKNKESLRQAQNLSQYIPDTKAIIGFEGDPKDYTHDELDIITGEN